MNWHIQKLMYLLGCLLLVAAGCQTQQPQNAGAFPVQQDPLTATNKSGLTLRDAQNKSLSLEEGMTEDQVVSLLGKPDAVSVETFGSSTATPWNGILWTYFWKTRWQLNENNPHNRLRIVFTKRKDNNEVVWVVRTWDWIG